MNFALIGTLLFLTFSHLTFGLKGEDRTEIIREIGSKDINH